MSVYHDRMIESKLRSLDPGCPIFTADGERIGTLAEVRHQHLKVDAPMRRDFWVDASYVCSCDGERIELSFARGDLDAYRVGDPGGLSDPEHQGSTPTMQSSKLGQPAGFAQPGPPLMATTGMGAESSGAPDPRADRRVSQADALIEQKGDLIVSEREQLEMRMRMEAELSEQRARLDHMHPLGEGAPPDTFGTMGEPVESELARLRTEHGPLDRPDHHDDGASSNPGVRWLWIAGAAALLGVVGAGAVLRRRKRTPRDRITEAVRELPQRAESGIDAAQTALNDGLRQVKQEIARRT